ncbi:hypothetical protein [Mucilaginibacter panaciglaebae]|uniref:Uncharacterized protein n=1 Tax=Mucilaginibacter panaciglaebae TaxID=502331 RepID=A0ABP7WYW4_9SPHI
MNKLEDKIIAFDVIPDGDKYRLILITDSQKTASIVYGNLSNNDIAITHRTTDIHFDLLIALRNSYYELNGYTNETTNLLITAVDYRQLSAIGVYYHLLEKPVLYDEPILLTNP